jgi:hypothetical protein
MTLTFWVSYERRVSEDTDTKPSRVLIILGGFYI